LINLFTTYYNPKNIDREKELNSCIYINCKNDLISKVYLLSQIHKRDYLNDNKIIPIEIFERPKFIDLFNIINRVSSENDINIIANTDIYFDDSLSLLKNIELYNTCFALTRWDVWRDGRARLTELDDSQDCWIFKGKIKDIIGNYSIGVPGCDNRLAHEITESGYYLLNPSISIKTYHLHISSFRPNSSNWFSDDVYVGPPHKYIIPDTLESFINTSFIHILTNKKSFSDYLYKHKIKRWYIFKNYSNNYYMNYKNYSIGDYFKNFKSIIILFYFRIPFEKILLMLISPIYYRKYIKR